MNTLWVSMRLIDFMTNNKLKLTFVIAGLILGIVFGKPFIAVGQQSAETSAMTAPTVTTQASKNYERFTHKSHLGQVNVPGTSQAQDLKCDSCHNSSGLTTSLVPTTDRNKQLRLKFPSHRACIECHVSEFTSKPQQTCKICHETKQGLIARPPEREFPRRYDFSAFFDATQHTAHMQGYGLPNGKKMDCNFCHQQVGNQAALTVASHPECYVCHSPNSGNQKASQKTGCYVCHTEQRTDDVTVYGRSSKAFGALFTHKTHVSYTNGRCNDCHTDNGGSYNQTSPSMLKITAHASVEQRGGKGCFSCHDGGQHLGRTVFSGEPGSDGGGSCNKCHTRPDGKVFPSSGLN
ncbi:MAG: cytochrome c3 family protein [Blastocatellia bacterium]